jgi:hypothetical protein
MARGIPPSCKRQSADQYLGSDQLTMVLVICVVELPHDQPRTLKVS